MPDQPTPTHRADAVVEALAVGLAHGSRSPLLRTPADEGLEYREVTYPSSDGTPLEAWLIPCEGSTRLVVAMHAFGFSRYGFPGHLEPWQLAFGPGNDTEVDFVRDYKILHDHGYTVLAFDFRNFGLSGAANGNLASNNKFEVRDVIGTLDHIRATPELAGLRLGIFARCMGANVVFRAAHTHPRAFDQVSCLVAPLLLSPRAFVAAALRREHLEDLLDDVDRRFQLLTGQRLDDGTVSRWAPSLTVPTLTYGVKDDPLTDPSDLDQAYEAIGATDKEMFWIEGTPRRWDGYQWFQRHPERVLAWFDAHMR